MRAGRCPTVDSRYPAHNLLAISTSVEYDEAFTSHKFACLDDTPTGENPGAAIPRARHRAARSTQPASERRVCCRRASDACERYNGKCLENPQPGLRCRLTRGIEGFRLPVLKRSAPGRCLPRRVHRRSTCHRGFPAIRRSRSSS